jgi:hypothetical protein
MGEDEMSERYAKMTPSSLIDEMEAWQAVADAPKEPGNASNAARDEANKQLAIAEAWYHRRKIEGEKG